MHPVSDAPAPSTTLDHARAYLAHQRHTPICRTHALDGETPSRCTCGLTAARVELGLPADGPLDTP